MGTVPSVWNTNMAVVTSCHVKTLYIYLYTLYLFIYYFLLIYLLLFSNPNKEVGYICSLKYVIFGSNQLQPT